MTFANGCCRRCRGAVAMAEWLANRGIGIRLATAQQPHPTEGSGPEVWPSVIEHHNLAGSGLCDDMIARDALGRERYGTPLRVWNGRDAVVDAYQEALDLIAYLEQVRLRTIAAPHPNVDPETFDRACAMVLELADALRELHASGNVPVEEPVHPRGES